MGGGWCGGHGDQRRNGFLISVMNSVYIYQDNSSNANQNHISYIILSSKNDAQQ